MRWGYTNIYELVTTVKKINVFQKPLLFTRETWWAICTAVEVKYCIFYIFCWHLGGTDILPEHGACWASTVASPLFTRGFWLFGSLLQWSPPSFHLGDPFDLDNLSDLLCLIHLVFFFFLSTLRLGSPWTSYMCFIWLWIVALQTLSWNLIFLKAFQRDFSVSCGHPDLPVGWVVRETWHVAGVLWRKGTACPAHEAFVAEAHMWM